LCPMYKKYNGVEEPYNQCRQMFPKTYLHNGYIDIMKTSVVRSGRLSGEKIMAYVMEKGDTIDIDSQEDWENAKLDIL
jgi:CMP-N-acetylneuraminic acid synthetase